MVFVTIIGSIIYSTKLEQQVNIVIKSSPQPNNFTSENGIVPHTTIYHKIFKKFLFFVKICGTKKHHDYTLSWLKPFFSQMSTMICISNFLWASNLGCAYSMWVFIGVIPLSLLYLIRPFGNVGCWHKSLRPTYSILQIIHCNICKFSMSMVCYQ